MRKILVSILLLAATTIQAQVNDALSLGPVAGFGHTFVSGSLDNETNRKFHPSLNGGVRLTYSKHPHWGFGAGLSFRTEGEKAGNETSNEEIRLQTAYIRLEPAAYYFFGQPGGSFRPKVSFGPSFGFLTGGSVRLYENNVLVDEQKAAKQLKAVDFGLAGAIGFNYRLATRTWLNADLAYTHGLQNIIKENADEVVQNRSLFLNVGVLFGIGSVKK